MVERREKEHMREGAELEKYTIEELMTQLLAAENVIDSLYEATYHLKTIPIEAAIHVNNKMAAFILSQFPNAMNRILDNYERSNHEKENHDTTGV